METIITRLPYEDYEKVFRTFVDRARFAELFYHDEATERIVLVTPKPQPGVTIECRKLHCAIELEHKPPLGHSRPAGVFVAFLAVCESGGFASFCSTGVVPFLVTN